MQGHCCFINRLRVVRNTSRPWSEERFSALAGFSLSWRGEHFRACVTAAAARAEHIEVEYHCAAFARVESEGEKQPGLDCRAEVSQEEEGQVAETWEL
jgi:hypothetical protein